MGARARSTAELNGLTRFSGELKEDFGELLGPNAMERMARARVAVWFQAAVQKELKAYPQFITPIKGFTTPAGGGGAEAAQVAAANVVGHLLSEWWGHDASQQQR